MQAINKRILTGRKSFDSGVLEDSLISLPVDDLGLSEAEDFLRVNVMMKVKSVNVAPSSISFALVDENTPISRETNEETQEQPNVICIRPLSAGESEASFIANEATVKLVDGVPSISLSVNSNDPVIDGRITVSYRVDALHAFS